VVVTSCHDDEPEAHHDHWVASVWFSEVDAGRFWEWADHQDQFAEDVARHDAVLLGARGYADRTLFGELVVSRELLARRWPSHRALRCAALSDTPEPNMDWVYRRNGMDIIPSEMP
jgi:hypothetical protein